MKRALARSFVLALASGAAVSGVSAQSITTLFNQNNGGNAGGGIYFQIVVGASPITITGLDTNTSAVAGTPVPFRVFTAPTTHTGNEGNAAAWTLASAGTGVAAGINVPTPIVLGSAIVLGANTSYGIALTLSDASGTPAPQAHAYSGTGTSPLPGANVYSNADLTLNLGTATNVLFGGAPFNPRIWNGTIRYTIGGVVGACCLPNFNCTVTTSTNCATQSGTYLGDNSLCSQCPQPPSGACCLPDGTCVSRTSNSCLADNGLYGGDNSPCATANCAKAYAASIPTPIPIPDGLGSTECGTEVFAEVNVPDSFTIGGIEASYHILHTFQGDVTISLEKVGGPTVVMVDRPGFPPAFGFGTDNYGASAANAGRFISNDTAANIYDAPATLGVNNPVGRWKSENAMAPFVGLNSQGMWRLKAKDCAAADTGTIVAFTLLLKGPSAASCYANCDNSTIAPCLNVNDFTCFLNAYGANLAYANCDQSTIAPVLNVNDFTCFLNTYGAGCGANNCAPRP